MRWCVYQHINRVINTSILVNMLSVLSAIEVQKGQNLFSRLQGSISILPPPPEKIYTPPPTPGENFDFRALTIRTTVTIRYYTLENPP
jgi:hypothetical protein